MGLNRIDLLVRGQAELRPASTAILTHGSPEADLSYFELEHRVAQLSSLLAPSVRGPEAVVAVEMHGEPTDAVLSLAVLRAGGVLLPVDPSLPTRRVNYLLAQADACLLVSSARRPGLAVRQVSVADLEEQEPAVIRPPSRTHPDSLCYVIATSGSTGRPKLVGVTHRNVAEFLEHFRRAYGTGPTDRIARVLPPHFDVGLSESWAALASGSQLVYFTADIRDDPSLLWEALDHTRCTMLQLTASLWSRLPKRPLEHLRIGVTGGETPSQEVIDFWSTGRRFYNAYGPTETTVFASNQRLELGRSPLVDADLLGANLAVDGDGDGDGNGDVDGDGGVSGLLVSGPSVTRGYLGHPRDTAEAYRPDPAARGGRRFVTGDLVERVDDDKYRVLGRSDDQVKVAGSRVDLIEVEECLLAWPGVTEAAAVVEGGAVVAFVVPADLPLDEVRARLVDELPPAAVPRRVFGLERLPLLASGKRDVSALVARASQSTPARPVRDADEYTELVARCWREILGGAAEAVSDPTWFGAGGSSLGLQRLRRALAQETGLELSSSQLLAHPTIDGMADQLRQAGPIAMRATPRPPPATDSVDCSSPGQERLWYQHQTIGDRSTLTVGDLFEIEGPLDLDALREALGCVVSRHEVLRTGLVSTDAGLRQVVRPMTDAEIDFRVYRAADDLPWQRDDFIDARMAEDFDLAGDPLIRLSVLTVDGDGHWALLTAHHVAVDGWSGGLLRRELGEHYARMLPSGPGGDGVLPEPRRYSEYAAEEAAARASSSRSAAAAELRALVSDARTDLDLGREGMPARAYRLAGSVEFAGKVDAIADQARTTRFVVLLAALGLVAQKVVDPRLDVVAVPVAGRPNPADDHTIGYYSNTLLLPLGMGEEATVGEYLTHLAERVAYALDRQSVPLQDVIESQAGGLLQPFSMMFTFQNGPSVPLTLPRATVRRVWVPPRTTRAALEIEVEEADDLAIAVAGDGRFFDEQLLRAIGDALHRAVSSFSSPDRLLRTIGLGEPDSPTRVAAAAPRPRTVHEQIEWLTQRLPDARAVVAHDGELTYAELDVRAGRLAQGLRSLGVQPESRVVIALDRSARAIVTMLAVLKAGGVIAPVDLTLPAERMRRVLEVVRPSLVVTTASVGETTADFPTLDGAAIDQMMVADVPPLTTRVPPRAGCFATFTSGSTGSPKGILLEHLNVQSLFLWCDQHLPRGRAVLQFTSLSFDLSLHEIMHTLWSGGAVHVPSDAVRNDFVELARYLASEAIDKIVLPTAAAAPLAQAILDHEIRPESLRVVVVAGEQLHHGPLGLIADELPMLGIWNHYGPAETHAVTAYRLPRLVRDWPAHIPIGRPADGTRACVVDPHGTPLPRGAVGELHIGGLQVGRGYENDPRRTAERFVPDPDGRGARRYRTGDQVRDLHGELVFLGRLDAQVKIRSKRVELGDVEAAIMLLPGVSQAAVVDVAGPSGTALAAIVVPQGGEVLDGDRILRDLRVSLPEYMVPSSAVVVAQLPMTVGGKVNRRALRDGWRGAQPRQKRERTAVVDQSSVDERLVDLWRSLLGLEELESDTNFFEVGGHSLLAVALISQVKREFGVAVALRNFLRDPTPRGLSELIRASRTEDSECRPEEGECTPK